MSKLAQEALDSCAALRGNLEELHRLVVAACPRESLPAIEVEFRNVVMNLGQIRARVPGACVCEAVKEPPTLAEIRRQREVPHVPQLPQRELSPPPRYHNQGNNA
ncbi:MAG TPA: hypothetical protein VGE39_17385 [Prosthecobacter sp.]